MKYLKLFIVLSLLVSATLYTSEAVHAENGSQTLKLKNNSNVVLLNGATYTAAQPVTIKNGITYVVFSSLANWYGFKVSYDAVNNQSIAKNGAADIRFKVNSKEVVTSGKTIVSQGTSFHSGRFTYGSPAHVGFFD